LVASLPAAPVACASLGSSKLVDSITPWVEAAGEVIEGVGEALFVGNKTVGALRADAPG